MLPLPALTFNGIASPETPLLFALADELAQVFRHSLSVPTALTTGASIDQWRQLASEIALPCRGQMNDIRQYHAFRSRGLVVRYRTNHANISRSQPRNNLAHASSRLFGCCPSTDIVSANQQDDDPRTLGDGVV